MARVEPWPGGRPLRLARSRRAALSAALAIIVGAATPAAGGGLVDPGPFGPARVELRDGRLVQVPAETHAFYRMLTQDGRLQGKSSKPPSESDVRAGIALRRQHEPRWTARFGDRPRTEDSAYVFPVQGGRLPERSGYTPAHRAEDIFAPSGRKVFAPATMFVVHAGYLSRTAGEAVVGFVPPGRGQHRARYIVLVHIDATPARSRIGTVVEPGTVIGAIAERDEAIVGNALGRPPHLHFVIREEREDGHLEGTPVWGLLRRANTSPARTGAPRATAKTVAPLSARPKSTGS